MKQTLMKLRDKTAAFMAGRYGTDDLSRAMLIAWCALLVLSGIASVFPDGFIASMVLHALWLALAVLVIFRMFSRNISKRSAENYKYLTIRDNVREFFHLQKLRHKERKTHVYKKCPHCKKVVRLSRIKGKHTVRCPLCTNTFKVRIHGGAKK